MRKTKSLSLILALLLLFLTACSNGVNTAVKSVEDAIGEIDLNSPAEEAITHAREQYDVLSDEDKGSVTNYQTLIDAEAALEAIKRAEEAAQESKRRVEQVEDAISALSTDSLNAEAIENARSLYDALSEDEKQSVGNYSTLTDAEKALIEKLEAEKKAALSDLVSLLQTGSSYCSTMRTAILYVWGKAIDSKNADFNMALSALYSGKEYRRGGLDEAFSRSFVDSLEDVAENYASISASIEGVSSYSLDDRTYEAVINAYTEYTALFNLIQSPSGSYTSFSSATDGMLSNITKAITSLKIAAGI